MKTQRTSAEDLSRHLLDLVSNLHAELGHEPSQPLTPAAAFADLLDSMEHVEFLLRLGKDLGVTPERIEEAVARKFGTVAELAKALQKAGLALRNAKETEPEAKQSAEQERAPAPPIPCWIGPCIAELPRLTETAEELSRRLRRPANWLEQRAGILARRCWGRQDPVAIAADASRRCLRRGHVNPCDVGALLVTSEAPPMLAGLAAALHHRLGLSASVLALEVGGACTGFLAALTLGRALLPQAKSVLIVALEAPTRYLEVAPGRAGEAAALFGDAAASCVLTDRQHGVSSAPLVDLIHATAGGKGHLVQVQLTSDKRPEVKLKGIALASLAVRQMAQSTKTLLGRHGLSIDDLGAVVAHGGNGRMPALLARQLGVPPERVWSETAQTGNLGSASLPVAWARRGPTPAPVIWTAVGAGLAWGAALTGDLSAPGQNRAR